ncbi:MAG: N-acetylmuramoyl-L-alanine amidase, partial [Lachnospiraceae bacterium]|nr:N-acetylmuramoyl-L-alanine amidase [Lachnospiraceae bacterium]
MKQLSGLTKIMFCIVAVLLVITVVLGIATAIKDGKENSENKGQETTVSPMPDNTKAPDQTGTPDNTGTPAPVTGTPDNTGTPTPEPTDTPTPSPTKAPTGGRVVAIDPGQQKKAVTDDEPIGPGATESVDKMSYGATSSTTGKREYEWTLILSEKIKAELEARGYEVVMTREENDVNISNAERAQAVNATNAEIYVSIQADAVGNESANGIFAQIPSKDNDYVKALYNDCKKLATEIQTRLIKETGAYDRGVRTADNVPAINYSEIPVTVLQLGFMSNKE